MISSESFFAAMVQTVREKNPLVHCITNYVTVNDCANALLAIGGSPVMADDIGEAADIASICSALVINMGTLNERTVASMFSAGKQCVSLGHPVLFDPVGAGASKLRTETAFKLIQEIPFSVIRGNASEIRTLFFGSGTTRGVDADETDVNVSDQKSLIHIARELSKKTGAVVSISGATDIVSDGIRVFAISNGNALMKRVTGTGCMLSAITGAFCGAGPTHILYATVAAACAMGIAGEQAAERVAKENSGTGSFRLHLIDSLSRMDSATLSAGMKIALC